jgi:hypothetical protein
MFLIGNEKVRCYATNMFKSIKHSQQFMKYPLHLFIYLFIHLANIEYSIYLEGNCPQYSVLMNLSPPKVGLRDQAMMP